jgi:hypothetical protein
MPPANQGKDDQVAHELLFDILGNMQIGTKKGFHDTMNGDSVMVRETFRRLALDLTGAIHMGLDVIAVE